MKRRIKEIAEDIWELLCGVAGMVAVALIFFFICIVSIFSVMVAVYFFDKLMLGGMIFG